MTLEQVMGDLNDPDIPIRHTDLAQLAGLPRSRVAGVLTSMLRMPVDRRRELIDRMSELADHNIELDFTAVFRACLRDPDASTRARAARGLWDSEDRTIIRPLIELLTKDEAVEVRVAAADALSKFAELAGEGKLTRRDGVRISEALLGVIRSDDEDVETRRRAIEAVAPFNIEPVRSIIESAYADSDARLRRSALYAMGRSSDDRWLPTVMSEMRSPDAAMRYEAAAACGYLGEEDTLPYLVQLLNDDDHEVQLAVVRSLGMIGGDLARRALTQAMRVGDDAIEEAAEEALESLDFDNDPLGMRFDP